MRRVLVLGLVLGACATSTPPAVTPERRAAITAAADACLPQYPTVERYEIDRWGRVVAWYKDNQGQTGATAPFFDCVRARAGTRPATAGTPPAAPVTGGTAPPPSRIADRLKELDGLWQQRLISEEEYQATRKRIFEGL
jgi:hypothetical protein